MSLFRAAAMGRISLFRNPPRASFIDTPFQRGGGGRELVENRFQRFIAGKTAEAVATTRRLGSTPLKRGVNQSMAAKGFRRAQKVRCAVVMPMSLVLLAVCISRSPVAAAPQAGMAPEQQKRLELMKSKGPDGSLTILPVRLAGKPWDRVTEVVGLLLEKQGLRNIELGKTPFTPAETDLESLAAAVGAFVKTNPITTSYALYAEYNGDHKTGLKDLRAVVVDQTGAVVWTYRLTADDPAIKRMGSPEPMSLSVLLVERLSPQLGLNEETARAAKPGKLAAIMDERSGLPPENERAALSERQKAMKQALPGATLLVYPARIGGNKTSVPSAANIVRLLNQSGLCKAVQADQTILLKTSLADPNELKALWNLAREFREFVRANPPAADYALYADYAFNPQNAEQGFVHFVVCDRKGEWVIVDMQNSHHPDYQSIGIISSDRCDQLLVKRLEGHLK
jgi:hypothetical protein